MSAELDFTPVRICVADKHPLVLEALGQALDRARGFEVVALCSNGHEVLDAMEREHPGILLLDPMVGGAKTGEILRRAEAGSTTPILFGDPSWNPALAHYPMLSKELSSDELIREVLGIVDGEKSQPAPAPFGDLLSPREREALALASRGLSNKEIAARMGIAFGTVKVHLHAIFRKVGAKSRVDLVRRTAS
ncbi:MAG: response regulator transcription factor [Thermoanaerobaculia bacterium]